MAFIRHLFRKSAAVVCGLTMGCVVALAQTTGPKSGGEQTSASVNLNVIFTDEAGRSVNDVRREDVRVLENGAPQIITSFAQEERAASYGIIVDTTGSMRPILDEVITTAKAIVNANRPGDKTFVMHYVDADTIEFDTGLTNDRDALLAALDDLYIQGGLTATLDALHRALEFSTRARPLDGDKEPRHALVLITDGEDRGSRQSNPETLLARLRETNVQVFVIGLTKLTKEVRNRDKAVQTLSRIAQETGGRAFFPKTAAELPDAVKELTNDLRTQYVIGYAPTNGARDGSFRKVQVTLAPEGKSKRAAITRAGYVAPR
ncbi:MAG TPA: VWA domain-containing protein [Pyrinomonadaceae bacterium]